MRPAACLSVLVAAASLSSAFEWADGLHNIKVFDELGVMLHKRQNNNNNNNNNNNQNQGSASITAKPTASADASSAKNTGSGSDTGAPKDASATDGPTGTQSGGDASATDSAGASDFDPRLPPGGVSMQTPAAMAAPFLYKIGDWVTFGWNYTSLSVTPSAIDVLATCSKNQATYTLAVNQTVQSSGKVLWDTGAYQASATVPLLSETYTLIIYDAAGSVSATPKAGYMGVYSQFSFAMYSPTAYTPRNQWHCPGCSGAGMLSASERSTLLFVGGMAGVTVLSFTWFAAGFGVV